jgi:hypothetical protein
MSKFVAQLHDMPKGVHYAIITQSSHYTPEMSGRAHTLATAILSRPNTI